MRKLKEHFHRKHGIVSRIFSMVLALAMIVTMVPAIGGATTAYAASPTIRLYLDKPSTWSNPVVNVWAPGATVDNHGAGNATITQWSNQEKPKLAYEESSGLYYVDVQSSEWTGFQFVDAGSDEKAAPEIKTEGAAIEQIKTFTSDTSIYCLLDDNVKYQWYKDASKKETLIPESVPTECDLTINYKSTLGDDVAAYIYHETNEPAGKWPGQTMTATEGHEGWYTMHLTLDNSTDYTLILNNDGQGKELDKVTLSTKGKAEAEYWFDGSLSETKPADWKYVTTIHYLASGMGSTIYNYMWGADVSATGAGVGKEWPGGQISENANHSGWYDVVYTQNVKHNFSCIFNNNNGTQTDNIDVSVTSTSTELWVTGTKGGGDTTVYKTAPDSWEKPVPNHTFTIYYYNEDLSTKDLGKVDLWMWNAGLNGSYVFDGTYYDADNDVTWFKQTITVAGSNVRKTVGLKARYDNTTGGNGWDGGSDTADRSFTISGDENEVLYYVDGSNPVHEKPVIVPTEKRYLVLDYENPGLKEKDITPQFYTWSSGYASVLTDFTYVGGDKWTVKIPAKPSCTKVDFCIALDSTGDPWIKDGGDHSVTFPSDQKVIYASMKAGSEPEIAMPYNTGYEVDAENQQVSYYYRDDAAFVDGTLKDMTVSVDVNGTEYPMTYNDTTKRFEYVKSGLSDGKTHYRYKANGAYVVDAFNSNSEKYKEADYSYFEYYKLNATVTAEVMNESFNYNENNVVKFNVKQADTDTQKLEVASASIDVSSLGGSSEMPIEPELQAVTISATTDTALGIKTLPITVTDQYGNKFSTTVDVEITDRVKKNENDFDWDEAVVYFMMTDRFFDGNESNNTASGADTYGKNNPGLYHGGDFAGVTAKLDYLQDLGVNTIWLTPIVENVKGVAVTDEGKEDVPYNAAYHGYWASDFTKLNPTLGTTEEFETMISEAHKRGMRIMVDIVVNHAGYGSESTFADMLRDKSISEGDIKSWQDGLPDFATENADVRAKLVEWQTSWMKDYGVDYFRVDTVKHVDSTTWAALKNSTTEVNPSFKMIGEYYGAGYASNGSTLGTGQMDADLDFDFNDQATSFVSGNISSVESFLSSRNTALNNAYMTGQFLSSHDENGFKASLMNGKQYTEDKATAAALVAATLQLTAKGIPVIYYGEEVGLSGLNNYPYNTNRYDMDFSKATKDNVTYQHYKNLLSIRNAYTDVFARGSRKVVASSDEEGYDVVSRSYGGTTLYVGMNIKDTVKEVKVPVSLAAGTEVKDLYSGATYTVGSDKTVTVTIPAAKDGGTVILTEVKKTVDPTPADPGKKDPTPTPAKKDGVISVTDKAAIETKKAAPKSGDDNEAATYVCLLGLAMVAITAATYRKKKACK